MNTKATTEQNPLDTAKLVAALAMLIAGVVGFHYYADAPKLARVGGVLAAVVLAVATASFTFKGRRIAAFIRDAQIEARKVVWPTQVETRNTTLLVMGVVIVFAVLLWLLDLALGGLIKLVIGHGGA